jgi:hypothetical protein
MKLQELRNLIREEVRKVLKESALTDIPTTHPLKKDVERVFNTTFEPYCFKFDQREDLVGINISYLSDDTGIDPNKVTSLVRGMIRKNPANYMEIKMEKDSGDWPEKYIKAYPSLEELDPDYYMVVKLRM